MVAKRIGARGAGTSTERLSLSVDGWTGEFPVEFLGGIINAACSERCGGRFQNTPNDGSIISPEVYVELAIFDTFYSHSLHRSGRAETESTSQDIQYFCRISVLQDAAHEGHTKVEQQSEAGTKELETAETIDVPDDSRRTRMPVEETSETTEDAKKLEEFKIPEKDQGKYHPETSEQIVRDHPSLNATEISPAEANITACVHGGYPLNHN